MRRAALFARCLVSVAFVGLALAVVGGQQPAPPDKVILKSALMFPIVTAPVCGTIGSIQEASNTAYPLYTLSSAQSKRTSGSKVSH